jgi:hypothetical protein
VDTGSGILARGTGDETQSPYQDKMEEKWAKISGDLAEKMNTTPISTKSLLAKYNRLSADVLKKYGISEEGANLSGLNEEPTQIESLIISLNEEASQQLESAKETKRLKREREEKMEGHEHTVFQQQMSFSSPSTASSASGHLPKKIHHDNVESTMQHIFEDNPAVAEVIVRIAILFY